MKLFLASLASETLDLVLPLLPAKPKKLKLAYIPTAADPYDLDKRSWAEDNYTKLTSMGFEIITYDLKDKNPVLLRQDLASFQVIFVEGGNVFYLLNEIKKSGFDLVIKELLTKDIVYIGSSAGSMIMGPDLKHLITVDDPGIVPELTDFTSLNYLKERIIPHAGRAKYAEKHANLQKEWGDQILLLRDDQALVVNDDKIEVVTK